MRTESRRGGGGLSRLGQRYLRRGTVRSDVRRRGRHGRRGQRGREWRLGARGQRGRGVRVERLGGTCAGGVSARTSSAADMLSFITSPTSDTLPRSPRGLALDGASPSSSSSSSSPPTPAAATPAAATPAVDFRMAAALSVGLRTRRFRRRAGIGSVVAEASPASSQCTSSASVAEFSLHTPAHSSFWAADASPSSAAVAAAPAAEAAPALAAATCWAAATSSAPASLAAAAAAVCDPSACPAATAVCSAATAAAAAARATETPWEAAASCPVSSVVASRSQSGSSSLPRRSGTKGSTVVASGQADCRCAARRSISSLPSWSATDRLLTAVDATATLRTAATLATVTFSAAAASSTSAAAATTSAAAAAPAPACAMVLTAMLSRASTAFAVAAASRVATATLWAAVAASAASTAAEVSSTTTSASASVMTDTADTRACTRKVLITLRSGGVEVGAATGRASTCKHSPSNWALAAATAAAALSASASSAASAISSAASCASAASARILASRASLGVRLIPGGSWKRAALWFSSTSVLVYSASVSHSSSHVVSISVYSDSDSAGDCPRRGPKSGVRGLCGIPRPGWSGSGSRHPPPWPPCPRRAARVGRSLPRTALRPPQVANPAPLGRLAVHAPRLPPADRPHRAATQAPGSPPEAGAQRPLLQPRSAPREEGRATPVCRLLHCLR
eukprot:scaffold94276_cov57-Phaeocystis_antarctica.AAC.8